MVTCGSTEQLESQLVKRILHINYKPAVFWARPLLVALSSNASLKTKYAEWSRLPISLLTFSIETRLGSLREIIKQVDQNLSILGQELKGQKNIDKYYIEGGAVYTFKNETAVRQTLIGTNCFVFECRSCFENLASFYREFSRHYFSEDISKSAAYEKVASLTQESTWADDLRNLRHDIIHDQAPWLAFLVRNNPPPKYEPLLVFNLTAQQLADNDYVPFENLRRVADGLAEAVQALGQTLAIRVQSTRGSE